MGWCVFLSLTAERIRKRGAAGCESRSDAGDKAGVQARSHRIAWESADGTGKLIDRQRAIILDALESRHFKNDAGVVDPESTANHGLPSAERVIRKAHTRSQIFLIRMMVKIDYVRHPHARTCRL